MKAYLCQRQGRKLFLLLLALTLIRGIIYISLFPPWMAPDEPAHFEAVRILGQQSQLPTKEVYQRTPMLPEMAKIFSDFRIWQESKRLPIATSLNKSTPLPPFIVYYPPISQGSVISAEDYSLLYHRFLATVSFWTRSFNVVQQVYYLRYVSLLLTLLTVSMSWYFARLVFPDSVDYAVAVTSFLVFLPTHMHINTSINTDVAATFVGSLFFLVLVKIFYRQSWLLWGSLAVITILATIVKPTTLFTIPTLIGAVIILLSRRHKWPPKLFYVLLGLLVVTITVGSVTVFQGTLAGRATLTNPSFIPGYVNLTVLVPSLTVLPIYISSIQFWFLAFWGLFGWATIHVPFSWVRGLWLLNLAMVGGIVVFFARYVFAQTNPSGYISRKQQDILLVLVLAVIFSIIGIFMPTIATQSTRWGPPGRYLFPALLPVALLLYVGFKQILPTRIQALAVPFWVTGWLIFDTATIFYVILPVLYG